MGVMHELVLLDPSQVTVRAALAVISSDVLRLSSVSEGRVLHAGQAAFVSWEMSTLVSSSELLRALGASAVSCS